MAQDAMVSCFTSHMMGTSPDKTRVAAASSCSLLPSHMMVSLRERPGSSLQRLQRSGFWSGPASALMLQPLQALRLAGRLCYIFRQAPLMCTSVLDTALSIWFYRQLDALPMSSGAQKSFMRVTVRYDERLNSL